MNASIVMESEALALALGAMAGMYADLVKKAAFQGHEIDYIRAMQLLGEIGRLQQRAVAWLDGVTPENSAA